MTRFRLMLGGALALTFGAALTLALAAAPAGAPAPPPAAPSGPAGAPAQAGGSISDEIGEIPMTAEADKAVRKGLGWLAGRQNLDGSWDTEYRRNTGVMAVALLAFLASGNPPGQGEYGVASAKGLRYLLTCAKPGGMIVRDSSHGPMYEHALSTLYLAEVWGMTRSPEIKDKVKRAIELIIQAQNKEGQWGYQPIPHGGDISVTIMQVMALRAAHDAGIEVPRETIERALKFVRKCHNSDGGYSYTGPPGLSNMPRTAAGVCCLQFAGEYKAKEVRDGLDYLLKGQDGDYGNYFYAQYYGVHAFYFAGGEYWKQWYPKARQQLLAKQNQGNGSWGDNVLDTGWAVMCLSLPHRYLPVYDR
jgi:hypothetical protein